ncbi:ADP-ribosyltransferase [Rathayibacter sp. YIM 133350]|uniref:ADP-ribosyltransferase n=1 Tax=Rathayibacter sp. YIM 133350 TaxID=3131992 RepID=UPI00307E7B18
MPTREARTDAPATSAARADGIRRAAPRRRPNPRVTSVEELQAVAGNRATTRAVQTVSAPATTPVSAQARVQRESPAPPGALVLKPEDPGGHVGDLSWSQLQDAIDEHRRYLAQQTSSSPEVVRRENRLAELESAQRARAGSAATAKPGKPARKGRPATPLPERPHSLDNSMDLAKLPAGAVRAELDRVVAYLAAGPSRADRAILELELPYLESAAGVRRAEKQKAQRLEALSEALSPTTGTEADQLIEMLTRVQDAERDPSGNGTWYLHYGDLAFPLQAQELVELRGKVAAGLTAGAAAVNGFIDDVESAWKERTSTNRKHNIVHGLVKFTTGADDIPRSDIDRMVSVGNTFMARVRQRGAAGALVLAGGDLLIMDRFARHWAQKVGQWESTLMGGAGRWVLALTILKESLGLIAGVGAAGFAAKAGGGLAGVLKAGGTIASITTATGAIAGGVSSAVTGRDVVSGVRAGGGAGFGVGANALTAGTSRIASIADAAKASGAAAKAFAVGKAVALDAGVNVATGVTQAAIEGNDKGSAALGALAMSPINTLGGGLVDAYAEGKAALTVGKAFVGGTAGVAGAAATGSDLKSGALLGAGGGAYGELSSPAHASAETDAVPAPENAKAPEQTPEARGSGPSPAASPSGGEVLPPELLSIFIAAAHGSAAAPTPAPAAASAVPAPPPSGAPADERMFTPGEVDAHLAGLEDDVGGHNADGANLYSVSGGALRDARFSRTDGSALDVGGIARVGVQEGNAPLSAADPHPPTAAAPLPPETWLLDPARANLADPALIADEQFRPNRTDGAYDVRNAQIVAGPDGERITTPAGPMFGPDRVVGGAMGAAFDPTTPGWIPAEPPYARPFNPLGQDAAFQPRTTDEWHAWEQTHGPLTEQERYALWFYSDDLSGHLNRDLRGQAPAEFVTDPHAAAAAASVLDRSMRAVPFDTVVHRRASLSEFRALGVTDPAQLAARIGQTYTQHAYESTSIEAGHWSGAVDMVIEVPKGTRGRYLGGETGAAPQTNPVRPEPGAPLASMPAEVEFLIERGTSFTIQNATHDAATGRWTVHVRVAAQGEPPAGP